MKNLITLIPHFVLIYEIDILSSENSPIIPVDTFDCLVPDYILENGTITEKGRSNYDGYASHRKYVISDFDVDGLRKLWYDAYPYFDCETAGMLTIEHGWMDALSFNVGMDENLCRQSFYIGVYFSVESNFDMNLFTHTQKMHYEKKIQNDHKINTIEEKRWS